MRVSSVRAAFLAVLIVTVAAKVSIAGRALTEPPAQPEKPFVDRLRAQGFAVTLRTDSDPAVMRAVAGACRLSAAIASPAGWDGAVIRRLAQEGDRTYFVFRGSVYTTRPVIRTSLHYYWWRASRSFGIDARLSPVLAVIASPACDAATVVRPFLARSVS
jgi:hypothetical protein